MQMKKLRWLKGLLVITAALIVGACQDDEQPVGKGEAAFEITDAPVDDANVKGVFVTVADVKVNGHSIEGFSKQTIDLKAYSEGKTKLLGSGEFDARTYDNLVLVLDLDQDATGNSPGCYVLDDDNAKHKLKTSASGTADIVIDKSWSVTKDAKTNIVLDFDLRKALRYTDEPSGYSFVGDDNLQAAVKLVTKSNSGTIVGTYEENTHSNADKIIVYAYKKGTFDVETETTAQGDDHLLFAHAAGSAEVKGGLTGANEFKLAFLEEGDYELHFVGYTHDTSTGRYHFQSQLQSETSVDGSVGELVTVKGGLTINISTVITGIL